MSSSSFYKASGTSQTLERSTADAAADAEKLAINAEDAQFTLSDGSTIGYSAKHHAAKAEDHKTAAQTAKTGAETARNTAEDHRDDAQKLAINAEDSSFTLEDGVTTGYSALHYNAKAEDHKTAAETAKTAAETAKTGAETAKTAAETAKTGAETAKTAAETAKTAAETAQTAAETAETNAETALETFQAQYLGANATDPTVDGNGDAVTAGDLTFNSTDSVLKVYSGSAWQQTTPTSANQTNINTVAGISSDITSVAGKASLITSDFVSDLNQVAVADVISDINTLATSDIVSDLNTLATSDIVSDINLLATSDIVSDLNTLATSAIVSDLSTVADNITDVNNFADRYNIGSSAPASPSTGTLWFDSANDVMKVYGSGGFQNAGSSVNGTSERKHYVVGTASGSYTGSTTVFPATYDAGFVDVYLNGVKLADTDFTATNGTSMTLGSAAATGDQVDIIGYGTFQLANFSVGDANNVDINGLADDQILRYNSTSGNFEAEDLPTGIPSQSTHSGKFLTTDGTNASWATVNTDLVGDTTPQLGGDLDTNGNSINFGSSKWSIELDTGDNDLLFKYNGTTVFKLSSAGAVVASDNITAYGTP